MATIKINPFQQWEFTSEEELYAYQFNDLNLKALQNEIAIAAQEKIALTFDPLNPVRFAQQEAELAGKIEILQYLISRSTTKQEI